MGAMTHPNRIGSIWYRYYKWMLTSRPVDNFLSFLSVPGNTGQVFT